MSTQNKSQILAHLENCPKCSCLYSLYSPLCQDGYARFFLLPAGGEPEAGELLFQNIYEPEQLHFTYELLNKLEDQLVEVLEIVKDEYTYENAVFETNRRERLLNLDVEQIRKLALRGMSTRLEATREA